MSEYGTLHLPFEAWLVGGVPLAMVDKDVGGGVLVPMPGGFLEVTVPIIQVSSGPPKWLAPPPRGGGCRLGKKGNLL